MQFPLSFIQLEEYKKQDREKPRITGGNKIVDFDEIDIKILNLLSTNSRMPLSNMSKIIKLTPEGINFRIKQLLNKKIITGFRMNLDLSKIGYQIFKSYIYLENYNNRNKLINYIKYNPNLYLIDTTTAEYQLELQFFFQKTSQFLLIMEDFSSKFSDDIIKYIEATNIKFHEERWVPKIKN